MSGKPNSGSEGPLNDPREFLAEGRGLARSNLGAMTPEYVSRVMAQHRGDPLWERIATAILSESVPYFHLAMLKDTARNAAYRAAIERLAPGRRVLDIDTGSGLLAMMAARAGATHIYACEETPMLAGSARAVIEANGLSDRITVFDRRSTDLDRDRDLDGGVNLVISELFAHNLLGEGVLESLDHARTALALPDADFVPESADFIVALAEFPPLGEGLGETEGFDLSAFSQHCRARHYLWPDDPAIILRSEPSALFTYDFASRSSPSRSGENTVMLASTGGSVSGLAQWIRIKLADGLWYENSPQCGKDRHWVVNLIPGAEGDSAVGQRFQVGGWYADPDVCAWVERT